MNIMFGVRSIRTQTPINTVVAAVLVLMATISTGSRSSYGNQNSSFFVLVEAQHPIIKFVQMHTTHRNMNMMMTMTDTGSDEEDDEGDDDGHCRSLQQRLKDVEVQLAQSEHSVQEMAVKYELLQSDYDVRQKEHTNTVSLMEDKVLASQKMATVQEELTQRTVQLQTTTSEELRKESIALQALQEEHQTLQRQQIKIVKDLQQSSDQRLSENQKECQDRIDSIRAEADQRKGEQQQRDQLERQILTLQSDKSTCTGEMNALQTQLNRAETKYESILKEYDVSLQKYINDNFDAVVQNQTDQAVAVVQEEYDAYQKDCRKSLQQLNNEVQNTTQILMGTVHACEENMDQLREQMAYQKKMLEDEYVMQEVEYSNILRQTQEIYDDNVKNLRLSLELNCNDTVLSLNTSHANAILEYENTIANLTVEHNETIRSLLVSQNDTISKHETTVQTMTRVYNATMKELEMTLTTRTDEYQDVLEQLLNRNYEYAQLQEQYQFMIESSQYWEQIFHQRSYINATHIVQDVYLYSTQQLPVILRDTYIHPFIVEPSHQFYHETKEYYHTHVLQQRIVPLIHYIKTSYQEYIVLPYLIPCHHYYTIHVLPHLAKVQHVYMSHGHQHTMNAINILSTNYQQHVQPLVLNVYDKVIEFYYTTILDGLLKLYDESILHYRTIQCPRLIQSIMKTPDVTTKTEAKPRNITALQVIQYTCENPHDSIWIATKIVLAIIVLIFHQTILRLLWYTLQTVFIFIVWTCNPMRVSYNVLFGRRRVGTATATAQQYNTAMSTNGNQITTEDDLYIDNNRSTIPTKSNNVSSVLYQNGSTAQQ